MAYEQVRGSNWMNQINNNFALLEDAELIELASSAETITGTDTAKAVTPAGFAAGLAAGLAAFAKAGTHTVVSGEATAETLDIATGLAGATVFIVQIFRSGVMVMNDAVVSMAAGVLTVANGAATYDLTADDLINWIVF